MRKDWHHVHEGRVAKHSWVLKNVLRWSPEGLKDPEHDCDLAILFERMVSCEHLKHDAPEGPHIDGF